MTEKIGLKAVLDDSDFQRGMRGYTSGIDKMLGKTEDLLRAMQPVGLALGAVGAGGLALVKSSTMAAARVEELGIVLDVMAENAYRAAITEGDLARASTLTTASIDSTVEAIKEQGITTRVASTLASQFIRYELDLAKASDLARVAQDSAVIAMQDSSEALEGLIHGIVTYNPRVLRTYGIMTLAEDAFKKFAEANETAVDEMTSTQRVQAMLNAVLEEGTRVSGAYEAAMTTAGKQLRSLNRHWEEARVALGTAFLPLLTEGVGAVTDLLKAFNALDPAQQQQVARLLGVGTAVTTLTGAFILLTPRIIATMNALRTLGTVAGPLASTAGLLAGIAAVVLGANAALEGHHEKTIAVSDSYERYVDMMRKTGRAAMILSEAEWEQVRAQAAQAEQAETSARANEAATQRMMGLAAAYAEVTRAEAEERAQQLEELAALEERMAEDKAVIAQRIVQMDREYNQALMDQAIERARRIEDIERDLAQRRAAAAQQLAQRLAQIEASYRQAQEQGAYDHARRMEDIERQYQERVRDIEEGYQESIYEAIAGRDATAALKAMRQRKKGLDDARRDRDQERADAEEDYARQREQQRQNYEIQRQQAQQAYQQQLADLQAAKEEQIAELDRNLARQREDLLRHNQWTIEAMKAEFLAEYGQAVVAYAAQENAYRQHLANMRRIWASMGGSWGGTSGQYGHYRGGYQSGGAFVAQGPTSAMFGEGGVPELVTATPLEPVAFRGPVQAVVSGAMQHQVSGQVSGMMSGFEGRLTGAISSAVSRAFRDVLH